MLRQLLSDLAKGTSLAQAKGVYYLSPPLELGKNAASLFGN